MVNKLLQHLNCSCSELAGHADLVSGMRNVSPCVSVFNFGVTEGKVRPNWAWMEQTDSNKQLVFWGLQCNRINETFIGSPGAHWWMWMEIDFIKNKTAFTSLVFMVYKKKKTNQLFQEIYILLWIIFFMRRMMVVSTAD